MVKKPKGQVSFRKAPKIRIRQNPNYELKPKTIKMDPHALKLGIARYLLRKVSSVFNTGIEDNPFTNVIDLPPMMGFESDGLFTHLMQGPPMYYWHRRDIDSWVPQSREQATCVLVEGWLVVFGGLNSVMLNDINIHNFQKRKWFRIPFKRDEQQPDARYGHSAVVFKSKIYIYGGYRRYIESFKVRETYGDVFEFSPKTLKWDKLNCNGILSFRRNHIAETIGKHMLVHGGIDHKSRMLSDIFVLNLETQLWSELSITGLMPEKVSHHRSCLVMNSKIMLKTKFDLFDSCLSSKQYSNTQENFGVYIFGGINELGYSTNDLWILKVGVETVNWLNPSTTGKPPWARYGHSMHYVEFMKWVLIFGGRNDADILSDKGKAFGGDKLSFFGEEENDQQFLNDMWLLRTDKLEWVRVENTGHVPSPVYSHCSCVFGSEFIVFGGMSGLELNENSLNICELHLVRSRELAK
jgi:Rab9 effector protein with kelch motifs